MKMIFESRIYRGVRYLLIELEVELSFKAEFITLKNVFSLKNIYSNSSSNCFLNKKCATKNIELLLNPIFLVNVSVTDISLSLLEIQVAR
jgi:hypothetical protein